MKTPNLESELEVVNTLDAVRLYLQFVAGPDRRAQVETLAGWYDADKWQAYGTDRSKFVTFSYDEEAQAIRETPTKRLDGRIIDKFGVFGHWPVRFVEVHHAS